MHGSRLPALSIVLRRHTGPPMNVLSWCIDVWKITMVTIPNLIPQIDALHVLFTVAYTVR